MGASYLGFFAGLLLPLGHIGVVLSVYILTGRRAPIGTDVSLFLGTAILPFIIWSYTHQKVMNAFLQNKPLTVFPAVKFIDILIARSLVELLNSTLVACIFLTSLFYLGGEFFIANSPKLVFSLIMAFVLGVSTGFIFGLIALAVPLFTIVGFLFVPLYWITSGVFFIPDALPQQLRDIISFFPIAHIVDFGRTSFYSSYTSNFYNLVYVNSVILLNFLIGLSVERFGSPFVSKR